MLEKTLVVKYITSRDCFVYLSDRLSKMVKQGNVVKVTFENGQSLHFSVGPHLIGLKEDELALSSVYAPHLQLCEGDYVGLSLCGSVPGIKHLDVTPETADDFEILESMHEIIQETLLNQIRIVNNEQKVFIWITHSLHIIIKVGNIEPISPGRLDELTEVIVKPPVVKGKQNGMEVSWDVKRFTKYFKPTKISKTFLNRYNTRSYQSLLFRLQPVDDVKDKIPQFQAEAFFKVYIDEDLLFANYLKEEITSLRIINLSGDHNFFDETNLAPESIAVQICPVKNLGFNINTSFIPLFVSKSIFKHYNVKIGTKAILSKLEDIDNVSAIEIGTSQKFLNDVQNKFKTYLAENCENEKLLLNSNFIMDFSNCTVKLRFVPVNLTVCLVDTDFVRKCAFTTFECDLPAFNTEETRMKTAKICTGFSGFTKILDDCKRCYNLYMNNPDNELQNILIVGKPGAGKTTLVNNFANVIASETQAYVEVVTCKSLKGKSLDFLHKLFTNTFSSLIYYQPSILVLDDLHMLCEKVAEGDAPTQESIHFNKVSELLADLLQQNLENNVIFVLATAESVVKLNHLIFASRGEHLFKNVSLIEDINKTDRKAILEHMFSQTIEGLEGVDIEELALKTESFVIQDLDDFVGKCVFEACKAESPKIMPSHCESALHNTPALALRSVELHSPGDRDFSDIGGLEHVKNAIVECMLWPVQYSNIFAKSPLRLQSGLLLYGPPGTGKTILAGAAAKQCGLRLISVKGPELLSKYIGASEQAVRDIFQKAQSAKPCILFFDEFDSLAPRRGHDNTGVTDRVVNQFLTQLDGVEALVGVCVLAATSRPDLLDPALLRPGRLDRQILCPLPDKTSRLAILKTLSKNLSFEDDVDLEKVAEETQGFSGADLQAVLYTAQLASVEFLLDENPLSDSKKEPTIDRAGLEEAVRNTRPSLTTEEKWKYEHIYAKFQEKSNIDDIIKGKQKTTLA